MSHTIELVGQEISITLTPDILAELFEQATTAGLNNWTLSLAFIKVEEKAATDLIQNLAPQVKAKLRQGSNLYELKLTIVQSDHPSLDIQTFATPILISLKIGTEVNSSLSGVYFIDNNGRRLEYVGGKVKAGFIQASVSHFSKYGVLEYEKTFQDVPASHWAYASITELAAKHIVNGVTDQVFGKDLSMTRAELTSLIVRAFGLQNPDAKQSFTDVSEKSWYSADVASALQAGIVAGKTTTTFAPQAAVTRSEVAVILMRALKRLSATVPVGEGSLNHFVDKSDVSPMYIDSLSQSVGAGLLKGDHNHLRPNDVMTRAEAAIVLLKLHNILESQ
nr:S-layer homology domain-containing protein [Cohnella sp. WQ 127256]